MLPRGSCAPSTSEGADDLSFKPIVGSGPNAALPHHHPGERELGAGETVVVDLGAKVDGYCSPLHVHLCDR